MEHSRPCYFDLVLGTLKDKTGYSVMEFISFRYIGIYLFIGFLFSLIRTYFKGKELKKYDDI